VIRLTLEQIKNILDTKHFSVSKSSEIWIAIAGNIGIVLQSRDCGATGRGS